MPKNINRVQLLQSLELIRNGEKDLFKLRLKGYSADAGMGLPLLRLTDHHDEKKGIIEFDFLVKPLEIIKKNHIEYKLEVVYNLKQLPSFIRAIKVIAENNADIVLL
jgi:hypothetical protein